MGIDTETLSDLVVKTYLSNYEIVDGLVRECGFKSLFFWQPVLIMGGKSLIGEEQEMKPERDPSLIELYESVYSRVQQVANKYKNLYYMASIFDEFKPLIWIDYAHVTPDGNLLIAQKMLQVIMDRSP